MNRLFSVWLSPVRAVREAGIARWHAPLIVGCAVWASLLPWVPRGPALCRVTIEGSVAATSAEARSERTAAPLRRSLRVPAGSPTLRRLEAAAAAARTGSRPTLPASYYAERWRMAAASYYAERDRLSARSGRLPEAVTTAGLPSREEGGVQPVVHAVPAVEETPRIDAVYWEAERHRAERAAARLLASLPVSDAAGDGLRVSVGETLPGRPRPAGGITILALAALAALGMTYWPAGLAPPTLGSGAGWPTKPGTECLELPADWVVQRRRFADRLRGGVVLLAWGLFVLGMLGGLG